MQLYKNQLVIDALVRRHAEDAAFYWSQHDMSERSGDVDLSMLVRFNGLLQAHLDGLACAGDAAWPVATAALRRWRKPGEMFVCAYVAICAEKVSQLDELHQLVAVDPERLLRGVLSALTWAPHAKTGKAIAHWTMDTSPPPMVVASLRAVAIINNRAGEAYIDVEPLPWLALPLLRYMTSENAHIRAAACRVVGSEGFDAIRELERCLEDEDLSVRAQAAIAVANVLSRGTDNSSATDAALALRAAETLWQCIVTQSSVLDSATGWFAKQAARKLDRWVERLALMIPLGHAKIDALLRFMPPRAALKFVVYHGDPAHLPFVESLFADPHVCRYAGWVWQTITGIRISGAGLVQPETRSEKTQPGPDCVADREQGFPQPDARLIAAFHRPALSPGFRHFNGQPVTVESALHFLEVAQQMKRSIAARQLRAIDSDMLIDVRASAEDQIAVIARFRGWLEAEDEE